MRTRATLYAAMGQFLSRKYPVDTGIAGCDMVPRTHKHIYAVNPQRLGTANFCEDPGGTFSEDYDDGGFLRTYVGAGKQLQHSPGHSCLLRRNHDRVVRLLSIWQPRGGTGAEDLPRRERYLRL